jgi:TfoX/Sxy family transcriptional regulator of competence genes
MAKHTIAELEDILNSATDGFPKLTSKKMFGCHALWVDGNVFALVWKHGRIGVKLPEESHYEKLMGLSGAEPWKAGPMKMSHWVLVPESFHSKSSELKKWASQAHELCSQLEKKSAGKAKGSVAKSGAAKSAGSKPAKKTTSKKK